MKFELPALPPGWQWQPLRPHGRNELDEYSYTIQAVNKDRSQLVQQMVMVNFRRDGATGIKRLFKETCEGLAQNARLLAYAPNQSGMSAMEEVYEAFENANKEPTILA